MRNPDERLFVSGIGYGNKPWGWIANDDGTTRVNYSRITEASMSRLCQLTFATDLYETLVPHKGAFVIERVRPPSPNALTMRVCNPIEHVLVAVTIEGDHIVRVIRNGLDLAAETVIEREYGGNGADVWRVYSKRHGDLRHRIIVTEESDDSDEHAMELLDEQRKEMDGGREQDLDN